MSVLYEYCTDVLDNRIGSCNKLKKSCERLLQKIEQPSEYHFDETIAQRHIDFIERFCKIPSGKLGEPFKLEKFQKAQIEATFGFVDDNELREFNEVLVIEGRKNGKSSLLSAIMIDMLMNDKEGSPQVVSCATKLDQAKLTFNACKKMVQLSPMLSKHIVRRQSDLYFPVNMGTIKAMSNNTNSLDGLDLHCCVIDELAAIKNRDTYDLMKQSMSGRRQPLLFCITTNGFVRDNIFDSQYEYACGVLDGTIKNEKFLPFIYELDNRDEWLDPKMWIKANPSIGKIKSFDYLNECVEKAKDDESFRPTVLVKDFNLKENASSAWLTWDEANNEESADIPFKYCIGGFDAADTTDLNSAVALCKRPDDDKFYVKAMFWIPETVLEQTGKTGSRQERDKAPYELWVKQGLMRTCEGNKCDKHIFLDWFKELKEQGLYSLFIAYDPWHISDDLLSQFKAEFGQNAMIPVRQGCATLSEPLKSLKAELGAHRIVYDNNPVLKMCLMNTEIKSDINGNIQPIKGMDKTKRIDGTVALVCAYKGYLDHQSELTNLNSGV